MSATERGKKERERLTLAREAQGPLRDPQECSYCEHCRKPIRQQKFAKHFAWVAEGGDMFCRTSEDRKSLIGHQPKGE